MSEAALQWLQQVGAALKPEAVEGLSPEEYLICLQSIAGVLPEIVEDVSKLIEEAHAPVAPPPRPSHLKLIP